MKLQRWIGCAVLLVAVGCGGDDSGSAGASGSDMGGNGGTGSAGTSGVGPGGAGGMGTGAVSGTGTGGSGGMVVGGSGGMGGGGSGGTGTGGSGGIGTGGIGGMGTGGAGGDGTYCPEATDSVMLTHCPVCANDATCDAPTYTDNKDGTVSSSCCGLVWQQVESDTKWSGSINGYDESMLYCDRLKLPGTGWRVPTLAELQSLVVLGQTPQNPTIDRVAFPNASSDGVWSSTIDRFTPNLGGDFELLYVSFVSGNTLKAVPANELIVRCVRGGTGN